MITPKIAILILAHKNQQQLIRLIGHLKTEFSLYIHIDRKSKIKIFNESNVNIIKKHRVYWGSYNQIIATRELLKIATKNKHERYILISGQDLPIISNQELIKYFMGNKYNYLHGAKLPTTFWPGDNGGINRLIYYYFNRKKNNTLPIIFRRLEGIIHRMQDILKLHRKIPDNLYGGMEWFNLNHDAAMICLNKMYNKNYMLMFKYTIHPNEIVIQSILYNSKIAPLCLNDSLRYVDNNFNAEYPNVITLKDYYKVINSGKLFARKFDDSVDVLIIDKIFEYIKAESK